MDMQNLFDTFAIKNGQKEGDALLSWLFNFALGYYIRIRKVKENHKFLETNGTHEVHIYVGDVHLWCQSIHTISFTSPL